MPPPRGLPSLVAGWPASGYGLIVVITAPLEPRRVGSRAPRRQVMDTDDHCEAQGVGVRAGGCRAGPPNRLWILARVRFVSQRVGAAIRRWHGLGQRDHHDQPVGLQTDCDRWWLSTDVDGAHVA